MRVAILSRNRQLFSIQRLLREAKTLKVECEVFDPLDCQIVVGKNINNILFHDKPIPHFDAIIPRIGTSITDYGLAVVKQFEMLGMSVVNGWRGIGDSRNKLRCLQLLAEKGYDVPTTVLVRGSRGSRVALRQVGGTPAVIKLIRGTQGVGVMLAESITSAESVLDTMWGTGQDVILQQYISESAGRDIRAFVIGDKVVAAMRRQAREGEFRSNIHRGGEGIPIELKDQYKRLAVNAAKAVGLTVAGVDMLESLNGPKILEVNSSPGFEGIEAATGLNVARMIIQHAVTLARKNAKTVGRRRVAAKPVRKTAKASPARKKSTRTRAKKGTTAKRGRRNFRQR